MRIAGLSQLIVNYIKEINERKYTRISIKVVHKGSSMSWKSNKFNYLRKPIMITNYDIVDAVLLSGDKHLRYKDAMLISINRRQQCTHMIHISKYRNLWDKMNTSNTTVEKTTIGNSHLPETHLWSDLFIY